jgi:hypothetical protein
VKQLISCLQNVFCFLNIDLSGGGGGVTRLQPGSSPLGPCLCRENGNEILCKEPGKEHLKIKRHKSVY